MSRTDIKGEFFDLAFGVDHYTGAFVQLWVKPADDQERSAVKIDSFGVSVDEEQRKHLNPATIRFIEQQEKRFQEWKGLGREGIPNIDQNVVIDLARTAGFEDVSRQVYQMFDE